MPKKNLCKLLYFSNLPKPFSPSGTVFFPLWYGISPPLVRYFPLWYGIYFIKLGLNFIWYCSCPFAPGVLV